MKEPIWSKEQVEREIPKGRSELTVKGVRNYYRICVYIIGRFRGEGAAFDLVSKLGDELLSLAKKAGVDVSPSFMNSVMKSLIPMVGFVWDTFFIHFGVSLTLALLAFRENLGLKPSTSTLCYAFKPNIELSSRVYWPRTRHHLFFSNEELALLKEAATPKEVAEGQDNWVSLGKFRRLTQVVLDESYGTSL